MKLILLYWQITVIIASIVGFAICMILAPVLWVIKKLLEVSSK